MCARAAAATCKTAALLLLRLSVPGSGPHGGPRPEPHYGEQFDNAAVRGVPAEGRITLREEAVPGRFADGTRYTLRRPVYGFADLAHGPMDPQAMRHLVATYADATPTATPRAENETVTP